MNDIETGVFEIAEDLVTAAKQLSARVPDPHTWFVRIGYLVVDHFKNSSADRNAVVERL